MTDTIQDRLRSGMDNCDTDRRGVELGGVVLTMHQAAAHIDAQDAKIKALVEALESINRMTTYPVCASIDPRGYDIMPATKDRMELIAETVRAALAAAKETT